MFGYLVRYHSASPMCGASLLQLAWGQRRRSD